MYHMKFRPQGAPTFYSLWAWLQLSPCNCTTIQLRIKKYANLEGHGAEQWSEGGKKVFYYWEFPSYGQV